MSKLFARLRLHLVQLIVIIRWLMVKQDQFPDSCRTGHAGCHLNRAMAEPAFRFVITAGILRVMDQQIGSLRDSDTIRVVGILPFDIGRVDHAATGIFNAIDHRSIERVTRGVPRQHAYLWIAPALSMFSMPFIAIDNLWRALPLLPDNAFSFRKGMKGAVRGQFFQVHWKIRRRHVRGYKLLDRFPCQSGAKDVNGGPALKKGSKKREA